MCRFVIDLKAILNNFNCAKGKLCPGVKICAVVKANAYGFGSEKIAKLLDKKADYFAVARLSEFLRLKKIGIKTPVIILSSLLENDMKVAIKNGAELTVSSVESLKAVNDYAKSNKIIANVHLKVDTGMSRFGFNDLKEFMEENQISTVKELKTLLKERVQ